MTQTTFFFPNLEAMLWDINLPNRPRLPAIVRRQLTTDTLALGLSLLVVRIRGIHSNRDIDPS